MDLKNKKEYIDKIKSLAREKNTVIFAHYYTRPEIQEIADFIGDSLALAQQATRVQADILVMCGVHFMGETMKILCPDKKVLIPDTASGCSLADSCKAEDLAAFKAQHPDHMVVSYVNTTAEVKALTDIVVTSSNAKKIIDQLPADAKSFLVLIIILVPISTASQVEICFYGMEPVMCTAVSRSKPYFNSKQKIRA